MLLQVSGLEAEYRSRGKPGLRVLRGLSLSMGAGESIGIYGESGCGKTTLARAIPRLLGAACSLSGSIRFRGEELLGLSEGALQPLRGARLAVIFQEPSISLTPQRRVGAQVAEVIAAHRKASRAEANTLALEALARLFPAGARQVARSFPHELSGGERQRAAIARAACCQPDLLIADEPTASLDSITQRDVLDLLRELKDSLGFSLLMISHNRRALERVTGRSSRLRDGVLEAE